MKRLPGPITPPPSHITLPNYAIHCSSPTNKALGMGASRSPSLFYRMLSLLFMLVMAVAPDGSEKAEFDFVSTSVTWQLWHRLWD